MPHETGEIDFLGFVEVMTKTLSQHATRGVEVSRVREAMQQAVLPFEITATAYRRCGVF
jgi:hypothetical protein